MNDLIEDFLHFLIVERGLSANTIKAYERDLRYFVSYMDVAKGLTDPNTLERSDIVGFMAFARQEGNQQEVWRAILLHCDLSFII